MHRRLTQRQSPTDFATGQERRDLQPCCTAQNLVSQTLMFLQPTMVTITKRKEQMQVKPH
jgi:hypothetical protein